MQERTLVWLWLVAIGLIGLSNTSPMLVTVLAQETTARDSKQVKVLATGVELVEITPSAPKCNKQGGQTIRLKVTSEKPVEGRLYVHTGWKQWLPKDFANQKRGDEITNYRCGNPTDYKVYARAAGSSEAWPKP